MSYFDLSNRLSSLRVCDVFLIQCIDTPLVQVVAATYSDIPDSLWIFCFLSPHAATRRYFDYRCIDENCS